MNSKVHRVPQRPCQSLVSEIVHHDSAHLLVFSRSVGVTPSQAKISKQPVVPERQSINCFRATRVRLIQGCVNIWSNKIRADLFGFRAWYTEFVAYLITNYFAVVKFVVVVMSICTVNMFYRNVILMFLSIRLSIGVFSHCNVELLWVTVIVLWYLRTFVA